MVKIHLSKLLGDKKMTQKTFSEKTGIRYPTVQAYYHEYIKRLNMDDLVKICDLLGCRLDELLEYDPHKK